MPRERMLLGFQHPCWQGFLLWTLGLAMAGGGARAFSQCLKHKKVSLGP